MRRAIVLSGVSGVGKTKFAHILKDLILRSRHTCSIAAEEPNFVGGYESKRAFRQFMNGLTSNFHAIIVDAVNDNVEDLSAYVLAAQAYEWEVELITLKCRTLKEVSVATKRNLHSISPTTTFVQHQKISSRKLPMAWKHTEIYPFDSAVRMSGEYLREDSEITRVIPLHKIRNTPSQIKLTPLETFFPIGHIDCRASR